MGRTIEALLRLQSVELQLAETRRRLRSRSAAVGSQQGRVEQLQAEEKALHDALIARQKEAAAFELDLRSREADIAKLRGALNTAKTNKEYAAVLTQINTLKADNSKLEEDALKSLQAVDAVRQQIQTVQTRTQEARQHLQTVQTQSAAEVAKLDRILADLQEKRADAAGDVPAEALALFERIAPSRDSEAMARIEVIGRKPPHEYVCSGCNMSIRAEHANALRSRDELRTCDVCGRILYLDDAQSAG